MQNVVIIELSAGMDAPPCSISTIGMLGSTQSNGIHEGELLWAAVSQFLTQTPPDDDALEEPPPHRTIILNIASPVISLAGLPDAVSLELHEWSSIAIYGRLGHGTVLDVAGRLDVFIVRSLGPAMLQLQHLTLVNLASARVPIECRGFTQASLNFIKLAM